MISFEFLWTIFAFLKKSLVALLVVLREAADCGGICSITQPMSTHVHAAALHAACCCCMLCIRVGMWYNARPQQGRGDLCKTDADSVSCKAHSTCVCMMDTMSAMDKSIERSSCLKIETIVRKDVQFFYAVSKHDPQQRIKDKEDAWSGVRVLHVTISGVKGLNLVSTAI